MKEALLRVISGHIVSALVKRQITKSEVYSLKEKKAARQLSRTLIVASSSRLPPRQSFTPLKFQDQNQNNQIQRFQKQVLCCVATPPVVNLLWLSSCKPCFLLRPMKACRLASPGPANGPAPAPPLWSAPGHVQSYCETSVRTTPSRTLLISYSASLLPVNGR